MVKIKFNLKKIVVHVNINKFRLDMLPQLKRAQSEVRCRVSEIPKIFTRIRSNGVTTNQT